MRPQPEKDESVRLRAHANGRRLTGLFAPLETAYTGLLRDAQRGGVNISFPAHHTQKYRKLKFLLSVEASEINCFTGF